MGVARGRKGIVKRASARLRAWRVARGLSVTGAAARFGVGQQVWTAWERATKRPSLINAIVLEAVTDGDVRYEAWDYPDWTPHFATLVARRGLARAVDA